MSFVRPRELVSFDSWHVTRSPLIGKQEGKTKIINHEHIEWSASA